MRVEVVKMVRYYPDGFTLQLHHPGEVLDIDESFALGMVQRGEVSPIADRETKPLEGKIEIKDNKPASVRTRNARRTKVKPTDNEHR